MIPFVAAQVHSLIEDIRLLETFVTAPLGLYSDIKMLREALPLPDAADLSPAELQERRMAFRTHTKDAVGLTLGTIGHLAKSIDALEALAPGTIAPITHEWVKRARMVLSRAEEKVGADLRAATAAKIRGLYVIVGPDATNGRPVADVAAAALKGGAKVLQLRDKANDKGQVLVTAKKLKALCDEHQALFIMNDDADLAALCDAHGLHVGQGDLPVHGARRLLNLRQLVGRSNNTLEEALQSQADGADYIAIGAVFPTQTMGKAPRKTVGVETIRNAKDVLSPPVVAIGGINASNVAEVARAGADCICVVSAVTAAKDPEAAARQLVSAIESARK